MYEYEIVLTPDDNSTLLVRFPDIPEAITYGEDEQDALSRAKDALESVMILYMEDKQPIPLPRKVGLGTVTISLPALSAMKVALYEELRTQQLREIDLARRLRVAKSAVDRLLDLRHPSRLDQMEAAFRALGKRVEIQVRDVA